MASFIDSHHAPRRVRQTTGSAEPAVVVASDWMARMTDQEQLRVGWREWVALPVLGVPWIKAKIDTGAKTSALHAFDLTEERIGGERWVRFFVHPWQAHDEDAVECTVPVLDFRTVRSSSGHEEERFVVSLDITLAGRTVTAESTLTNRDALGFRMLIGREALAQGFLVEPGASYLGTRPRLAVRRRNRGRA
jgi:hypothetical protein